MAGPDFLIAGASRSGTTTLHLICTRIPKIFMPAKKELQFFNKNALYLKGMDLYASYFRKARPDQIRGETSPDYFYKNILRDSQNQYLWSPDDDCARRIRTNCPGTKIIFTLRSPITRIQSQFWKNVWQGREKAAALEHALREETAGYRKPESSPFCWCYYNRYSIHLNHWFSLFPKEQICILIFEEWIHQPHQFVCRLSRFLEIAKEDIPPLSIPRTNVGREARHGLLKMIASGLFKIPVARSLYVRFGTKRGYPALSGEARDMLRNIFYPEIETVETLLNRKLDLWRVL